MKSLNSIKTLVFVALAILVTVFTAGAVDASAIDIAMEGATVITLGSFAFVPKSTFEEYLKHLSLDGETFKKESAEKQSSIFKDFFNGMMKAMGDAISTITDSEEIKALKLQIKALEEKQPNEADKEKITKEITRLAAELKALQEVGGNPNEKNTLVKELQANAKAIKELVGGTNKEVVLKADTVRASIANNEQAVDLPNIGQLATRQLSMYNAFPRITVPVGNHNGTIRYYDWDSSTTVRAAAMRAENSAFPESTAKWAKYTLDLKKVGDTLPVSAEFYEDAQMFAAELEMFLMTNVALEIDNQICNGDNTGQKLKGLFNSTPAISFAGITKVEHPTIYDLLVIAQEQITVTGGAKYMPDVVFMNKKLINKMKLAKDKNENYIIPPFVSRDGREVDGLTVIESNVVPNNQLVIGDRRFGRIYEMNNLVISKGTVADQFVEDMETLKVRKRILFLIRNADANGFVKITDVEVALAAIAQS